MKRRNCQTQQQHWEVSVEPEGQEGHLSLPLPLIVGKLDAKPVPSKDLVFVMIVNMTTNNWRAIVISPHELHRMMVTIYLLQSNTLNN